MIQGLWGFLIRHYFDSDNFGRHFSNKDTWRIKITGMEVYENYHTPVHDYCYDDILWGDATTTIDYIPHQDCSPKFDTVIFSCTIEHMEKEVAYQFIQRLKKYMHHGGSLIIATYNGFAPKGEYDGNNGDAHKSGWLLNDFDRILEMGFEMVMNEVDEFNHLIVILKRK